MSSCAATKRLQASVCDQASATKVLLRAPSVVLPRPTCERSTGLLSTRPSENHSASSFVAFSTESLPWMTLRLQDTDVQRAHSIQQ